MTDLMSEEDFAELLKSFDAFIEYATATKKFADVAFYKKAKEALKAERQRVEQLKAAIQLHVASQHILEQRAEAAEAKLAEVRGLARFNVENGDPQMGGGYGPYRIKTVPKSRWINDGMFVRADELEALINPPVSTPPEPPV